MAAESGGALDDMVSVEEQPIDLSKVARKPMPPLIPISVLRAGFHSAAAAAAAAAAAQEQEQDPPRQMPPLYPIGDRDRGAEGPRKRGRPEQGQGAEWGGPGHGRLDRARSVPQLSPLAATLQRTKSMSESRIPAAAHDARVSADQHRQQLVQPSWIYVGYYSQLLHRFQAQEMLRQIALQGDQDGPFDDQSGDSGAVQKGEAASSEDAAELKRRQARPLTGKHVRTGTGASPATLLTLRRKIQARRQRQHEPSPQIGD